MIRRWLSRWFAPQIHIQPVRAIEGRPAELYAAETLGRALDTVNRALALISDLQGQLADARAELLAHWCAGMETDAQVAELERLRTKNEPR